MGSSLVGKLAKRMLAAQTGLETLVLLGLTRRTPTGLRLLVLRRWLHVEF